MTLVNHIPSATQPGILPTEIRKLVESRRAVKSLMAKSDVSPDLKHQVSIMKKNSPLVKSITFFF